jgi:hypothetical protein
MSGPVFGQGIASGKLLRHSVLASNLVRRSAMTQVWPEIVVFVR